MLRRRGELSLFPPFPPYPLLNHLPSRPQISLINIRRKREIWIRSERSFFERRDIWVFGTMLRIPRKKTTVAARFSAKQESFVLIAIWGIGGTLPSFDKKKPTGWQQARFDIFGQRRQHYFLFAHSFENSTKRSRSYFTSNPGQKTTTTFIWERKNLFPSGFIKRRRRRENIFMTTYPPCMHAHAHVQCKTTALQNVPFPIYLLVSFFLQRFLREITGV